MMRTLSRLVFFLPLFFLTHPLTAQSSSDTLASGDTATLNYPERVKLVTAAHAVVYGGSITGLSLMWYSKKPRTGFHFFDDNEEWLQIDKAGHLYGAYQMGRASHALWQYAGLPRKKSIWLGGLSGLAFQTIIEVLDGFQADYGFSVGDYIANVAGTAAFVSQQLAWDEQRLQLKFSSAPHRYGQPDLRERAHDIYGSSFPERVLKDYNSQTYWLSLDVHALFKSDRWPPWLQIAAGYGAEGMFGARSNIAKNKNGDIVFDRSDIPRLRQWYLSPDINFSAIKTNKRGLKVLFFALDAIKIPAPALEMSGGKLKGHLLYF